jgi:RNA polymerase sigma factor (sigma-70 family)
MSPEEFRNEVIPMGRKLYAFAFRFLNSREESEDVAQEVITRLWEKRGELIRYKSVEALAMTMTRNLCIDRIRHNKGTQASEGEAESNEFYHNEPVTEMENMEAVTLIKRIISGLDEPYKSAIILRDIEGLSYEEAAEITGATVNNLRVSLSRARKTVREKMTIIYSYGSERDKKIAR